MPQATMNGYIPNIPNIIPIPKKKNSNTHSFIELVVTLLISGALIYLIYTLLSPSTEDTESVDIVTSQIQKIKKEYLESSTILYVVIGILVLFIIGIGYTFYKRNEKWVEKEINLENVINLAKTEKDKANEEKAKAQKQFEALQTKMKLELETYNNGLKKLEKDKKDFESKKTELENEKQEKDNLIKDLEGQINDLKAVVDSTEGDKKTKALAELKKLRKEKKTITEGITELNINLKNEQKKLNEIKDKIGDVDTLSKAIKQNPKEFSARIKNHERYATDVFHFMTGGRATGGKGLLWSPTVPKLGMDIDDLVPYEKEIIKKKIESLKQTHANVKVKGWIFNKTPVTEEYLKNLKWEDYESIGTKERDTILTQMKDVKQKVETNKGVEEWRRKTSRKYAYEA